MPTMTADDLTSRRADLGEMIDAEAESVQIARPARGTSKRGDAEPIGDPVAMVIWPTSGNSDPHLAIAVPEVAGQRVGAIGYTPITSDVAIGDTVIATDKTYQVVGVGRWHASIAVAMNEIRPRTNL